MSKLNIIAENKESTVVSEYVSVATTSSSYQSEYALEKEFISNLKDQGYERVSFSSEEEMISNLRGCLELLNNYSFTDSEWNDLFNNHIAARNKGIADKAHIIQKDHRVTIVGEDGVSRNIDLINKDNIHKNKLQVMNQYEVEGKYKNRYDVTVLVNGLPLVHIELKKRGIRLREAFNQIERYQRESFFAGSGLFEYVQIFVISNGTMTKYYSNTTRASHLKSGRGISKSFEFTNFWADANNKAIYDLVDFSKTFFAKHTLLNIICKYSVFNTDEELLVMRPYQIVATEKILNKVETSHNYKKYGSSESGGYIWHTTGSGKTLTSFKTAILCTQKDYVDKVLFIVDRKDLDYQTMKEYDNFQKDCANSNASTKVLTEQLGNSDSKIIITTIQKLANFVKTNKNHEIFSKEVVLIFDECHRSQFGDMHKLIVDNFKKYYMFGFTGTPIFKENIVGSNSLKTTENLFGDKLHTYTIVDAINDKNVLKFKVEFMETVKSKENIADYAVNAIDVKEVIEAPERISNIVDYVLNSYGSKTKHTKNYSLRTTDNVVSVAKSNKVEVKTSSRSVRGFNSMFACSSIDTLKLYYNEFKKRDHNLKIATIFSYAANEELKDGLFEENNENVTGLDKSSREFLEGAISDYNEMFGTSYDTSSEKFQNYYRDVSLRMKNREIDLLIVVNMFLTGFDAKTLNTLWVDKNLKYHGLIQAFSRTNRILNSEKSHGNIVTFRNLNNDINNAISLFGDGTKSGVLLMKSYEAYYDGYDEYGESFVGYAELIRRIKLEYPLPFSGFKGEQDQKEFIKLVSAILKVRNILSTFDQFEEDNLITDGDLDNYRSIYLDLREDMMRERDAGKESIMEDVVFEMELVKQVEVNIDYILNMIMQYQTEGNDEILVKIINSMLASPSLRNKKDLIEAFIDSLTPESDIIADFNTFMYDKKQEELDELIVSENLNKDETYTFIKKSFERGVVNTSGTDIVAILPKMGRFSPDNARSEKKDIVVNKIVEFFDRFYSITE